MNLEELVIRGRAGPEVEADCPACGDTRGHLYVNVEKGVYFCHRCGASGRVSGAPPERREVPVQCGMAPDPGRLHEAYSALLELLGLSREHLEHLTSPKRGFTPEQARRGYRTLPRGQRMRLARAVSERADPSGVPGFFLHNSRWCLAGPAGILIPARDFGGRIRGIQVRPDDPLGESRYCWLSSAQKPGGTKAKSVWHVANPQGSVSRRVWVTEGPLKADISAERLGETVVAVPGVNSWAGSNLVGEMVGNGVEEAVVAYDMDAASNPYVAKAALRLATALERAGVRVFFARWDPARKGLDDILLSGGRPEVTAKAEWLERIRPKEVKGLNRVLVSGVLLGPPKVDVVRGKSGELKRARFSVVVSSRNGRPEKQALPVIAWGQSAEAVEQKRCREGEGVLVEGYLRMTHSQDAYGQSAPTLQFVATGFECLRPEPAQTKHDKSEEEVPF